MDANERENGLVVVSAPEVAVNLKDIKRVRKGSANFQLEDFSQSGRQSLLLRSNIQNPPENNLSSEGSRSSGDFSCDAESAAGSMQESIRRQEAKSAKLQTNFLTRQETGMSSISDTSKGSGVILHRCLPFFMTVFLTTFFLNCGMICLKQQQGL